ncbi:Proteasome component Ecm29 [Dillenia turbinata]|uniref:Proteasome component Ecm29 n=1 Tax=Dillenia turbinata TaxID=194707 RepID=A0AAN8Z7R3_9MAGN
MWIFLYVNFLFVSFVIQFQLQRLHSFQVGPFFLLNSIVVGLRKTTMAESSAASSTPSQRSDEEVEELLDRMLTRLALCDDSNLQPLLSKLIPFTISSLSSSSLAVRNKVIEILSHVNKRVKHQPEIGLPMLELWNMYTETTATSMVKNFCIVYVDMGFERMQLEEKEKIAPTLLASISELPSQHQVIILRMVVKVIGECHSRGVVDEVAMKYRSINGAPDRKLFLEFCLHTMLYHPAPLGGGCPGGLSVSQVDRITGKQPLKSDLLLLRKLGILNVIEVMDLAAELVYPLYLAASADCQEPVSKRGEELLKKKAFSANLDDPDLINRLLVLFNGTVGVETIAPESRISPGNSALRAKLMSTFCHSITAANSFPSTLQCIFGCIYGNETTSRLKQLGMEFTVWVFKHARPDQLKLMGPVILNGILNYLDSDMYKEPVAIARDTKTFAFQAIGLLSQRLPHLFRDKIDMAVRLFHALKEESQFLHLVIQDATNSLAIAYKVAPLTVLKDLEIILLKDSQAEQGEVRFCAVRWATTLFDLQHCPSRFICMLGAADPKLDIREMALEGLLLGKDIGGNIRETSNFKYPNLGEMLDYIFKQQPKLSDSTEVREQKLLFPTKMYLAMISFLLRCFEAELGGNHLIGRETDFRCSVERLCLLLEHAMAFEGSNELHANASKALITIGSHFVEVITLRYARKISWLMQLLGHVDVETRESAARLLGIASTALPSSLSDLISQLVLTSSGTQKQRFETQHGALCALGYVTANCVSKVSEIVLQSSLQCLTNIVNSENSEQASTALQALGHIGLCVPLPPLSFDSGPGNFLRERLLKLLSGDDIKAIQKIAIALGHLCFNETSSSNLNIALDLIFSLCRSKVEDVLFAAGEALSFLWGGVLVTADVILKTNYTSLSMISNILTGESASPVLKENVDAESVASGDSRTMIREAITRKLFDVLLYSNRKEERCSGTVWLLSLTLYCGHHPSVQKILPEIQEAFSHLLGDHNELTQELASQGMTIVYEMGDASMKKNLVNALVSTLTNSGKRKRAVKLVEESEVFQEGTIGEGLNGGKLSTYKELCSLANEMGQPDLIYKFMDLANYQASLNSKRGAAFGFAKIAKQAGNALQPHLRVLIPRLVRYLYDPDKNDAMAHIWKSLVSDSKSTIDEHLDLIIDDLLIQSGSRLWRSREASCLALADILQGRKFNEIGKHLKRIWMAAFRAMDDIKETVRISGEKLCRAITTLTNRLCDISLTEVSEASQAMGMVLPFLLTEGIMSKVDKIRQASIQVVMKLAKGAGITIRPHLSDLVCCMLESLSSLEDQGLNYIELHANNAGIQTEKLENLRISIAKGSPMWETLDQCIEVVDVETLNVLIPRLAQLVRSGVGLNTRVGIANFISLLVQKVGPEVRPFTGMLLRILFPVVLEDKSGAVKRAYASACALILKHATPSQAQQLLEDTVALHVGDRNSQVSCAVLLKSYLSMAPDVMGGYHAAFIPCVFVARFEDDKYVSGLYEEIWEESTSGERLTLQLYSSEIVSLANEGITSSSWASKKRSALAICRLSEVLGEMLSSSHDVLLKSLMKELPGRLWEGKDVLLDAIAALCKSCHEAIVAHDSSTTNAILNLIMSACKKKMKKYREAAFSCLEQVIKAFGSSEFFNLVSPFLFEMCKSAAPVKSSQEALRSDGVKTDSDEVEDVPAPHDKVFNCITSCIHVANLSDIFEQQQNLVHAFLTFLSSGFSWSVQIAAFSAIKELCGRCHEILNKCKDSALQTKLPSLTNQLFHSVSPKVIECIGNVKIAQFHVAASECLLEMANLYRNFSSIPSEATVSFKGDLLHQYEVEKNAEAKSLLKKCIDILEDQENRNAKASSGSLTA